MRNGGRGAQNLEAPQSPLFSNVIKLSEIWDDFIGVKVSQVAQVSQVSQVPRMR